jgi:hypothetical protein
MLTQEAVKCNWTNLFFIVPVDIIKKDSEVIQIIQAIRTSARLCVHRRTRYKTEIQESRNRWSNPVMAHCPVALYLFDSLFCLRSPLCMGLAVISVNLTSCACQ